SIESGIFTPATSAASASAVAKERPSASRLLLIRSLRSTEILRPRMESKQRGWLLLYPPFSLFPRPCSLRRRVARPGEIHDLRDELRVASSRLARGHGEFSARGEPGIWVGLDDINVAFRGQTHVDAAVVPQLQGLIGRDRRL